MDVRGAAENRGGYRWRARARTGMKFLVVESGNPR
jgi:hypothetical protein